MEVLDVPSSRHLVRDAHVNGCSWASFSLKGWCEGKAGQGVARWPSLWKAEEEGLHTGHSGRGVV